MFNNSAIPRVRYVTGWTIQSIAKNVPQLIFKSQENLEMMVNSGCSHMAGDHWTIRGFMATAFSDIFEAAAARDQKAFLNNYFDKMINSMLAIQFSPEAMKTEQFLVISSSISTCLECCDAENLR